MKPSLIHKKMNLLVIAITLLISSVAPQGEEDNPCLAASAQKSCAECIATAKDCGWCVAESYLEENRKRCDKYENHARGRCDPDQIQFPNDDMRKLKNSKVQDGDQPEDAVQLQPQRVRIRVRPNKPLHIPLIFRQAANYPVDLYYLMDLSNSMDDDKARLAELGNLIAEQMSAITKNFMLGFGSFVDKVVSPYVSTVPSKLRSPCKKCEAPYGFRNQLSLDLETSKFAQKVLEAEMSGNLDAPEGGFDAIMQAIVCEGDIGWRPISRRMLVFSTDAGFHYAGDGKQPIGWRKFSRRMIVLSTDSDFHYALDGKLGGIVTPNDGECHMENNTYSQSSFQDYPSVSQISNKIKDKSVSVIFAVTKDQFPVYEKLSQYIDSSTTGILANDSSNIVDLIQDNYEKISSVVKLRAENIGENMTVEFFSRCLGTEEVKTNECKNLKIGQSVTFDVKIMVNECPKDRRQWTREFTIKPAGYKESLTVVMDLICECDCEKPENEEINSAKCSNGNGTYECGKCSCNQGYYGDVCECKKDVSLSKESVEECIGPNSTLLCSGRGRCECGNCKCDERAPDSTKTYSGKYCECDDFTCPRHKKQLCGGSERGICDCGTCDCKPGYIGAACQCGLDENSCKNDAGVLCSGHGTCECGVCYCDSKYTGPKCEQCPACPRQCEKYIPCIKCRVLKIGKLSEEECDRGCPQFIPLVPSLEESSDVSKCQLQDDKECFRYFSYEFDSRGDVVLKFQDAKSCQEPINVLAIVGGVVGGILAVGLLLLLLWKFLVHIHDTREFAKFEKERQNAKWDTGENPIYKQATSTFKNPTYGGN